MELLDTLRIIGETVFNVYIFAGEKLLVVHSGAHPRSYAPSGVAAAASALRIHVTELEGPSYFYRPIFQRPGIDKVIISLILYCQSHDLLRNGPLPVSNTRYHGYLYVVIFSLCVDEILVLHIRKCRLLMKLGVNLTFERIYNPTPSCIRTLTYTFIDALPETGVCFVCFVFCVDCEQSDRVPSAEAQGARRTGREIRRVSLTGYG